VKSVNASDFALRIPHSSADRNSIRSYSERMATIDWIEAARRAGARLATTAMSTATAAPATYARFSRLVDICLINFPKIPFTCSWLPGKSRMNMALLAALGLLLIGRDAASFERQTLQDLRTTLSMLAVLVFTMICVGRAVRTLANREKEALRFEEEPSPVVMGLQLDHG
jgi:hypothetical protein